MPPLAGGGAWRRALLALCMAAGLAGATAAIAQAAREVQVTQILPLSGPVARDAAHVARGLQVAIDATNAAGGLRGARIRLVVADDRYQPAETERLFREAAAGASVAIFMPVGAASLEPLLARGVIDALRVPVIGAIPGAESLRQPGSPWLFHLRASDGQQMAKIVEHSWTVGQRRIALLHADTPYGRAALAAARQHLGARGSEPVLALPSSMADPAAELEPRIARLKAAAPEALIVVSGATQVARITRLLREQGVFAPIYAYASAELDVLCQVAGPKFTRGLGIAQVVPDPASQSLPVALDFQRDWARFAPAGAQPAPYAFEAYIAWRAFAEAMKGGAPWTREGVRESMERLAASIGGYRLHFAPQLRAGSSHVAIGVVDEACRLRY